jgi:cytochrome c-type biogenesis protein CcmH
MKVALAAMLALFATSSAWCDDALDTRLKALENELRCLVCQNQTLADSNAPLAEDLRKEVRDLATSGKSDDEIRAYLVARYGDFVLYKPPVKSTTYLLWFGPFVLLAAGIVAWWVLIRRRSRATGPAATPTESSATGADAVARARVLLDD